MAKLKAAVKEVHAGLDQPTVASLRESGAVLEKTRRRTKRAEERIAREARERLRREVKTKVKEVSALYSEYENKSQQGSNEWWR